MSNDGGTWSLVLAAGDGTRLSQLTTTASGETIPKQFCSLRSSDCLLQLALRRAGRISPPHQICTIVAAQHRRWWRDLLEGHRPSITVVQPRNRGTAVGAALSLLRIEKQDPHATVVMLPADHYVEEEAILARSLVLLADAAKSDPDSVYLLGAQPDAPDSELGYIVPQGTNDGMRPVAAFVEKPGLAEAQKLIHAGALWNMFIVAGTVRQLLGMLETSYNFVAPMRAALNESSYVGALSRLYEELPEVDFSRDVLAHLPHKLKALSVTHCGWTDLGTPTRVAATVRNTALKGSSPSAPKALFLDLAKAVGAL